MHLFEIAKIFRMIVYSKLSNNYYNWVLREYAEQDVREAYA